MLFKNKEGTLFVHLGHEKMNNFKLQLIYERIFVILMFLLIEFYNSFHMSKHLFIIILFTSFLI